MKSPSRPHGVSLAAMAAASLLTLLAACGGGGGSADQPAQTSSGSPAPIAQALSVSGTVTGFGSVIIDGVRYDDSQAKVSVDQGGSTESPRALNDVKLGMSVDAKVREGKLTEVSVRAALAGPISAIDLAAGSFGIYGQTVKVVSTGATPTLFEGVADLNGLAVSDRVEVHGIVDATRAIVATRVERKARDAAEPVARIGGVVTALDTTAKTFKFNDLTIDFSSANVTPADKTLANGMLVTAMGDVAPAAGRFSAKAVRIKTGDEGAPLAIGGRITAYTSLGDFTVSGVRVNAADATLEGGVAADVALGASVAAEGTVTAGVLKATKLRIIKVPADALASLKGEVTEFVSAASFKLRGTVVDASAATYVGGQAADLGNGAMLIVTGRVKGDVFKATQVEFKSAVAAQTVKLSGEMRDWNATARSFRLAGMSVRLADSVIVEGSTKDLLINGRRVAIVGLPDSQGVVIASRLTIQPELAAPTVTVVGGRAYDVADGRFKLPSVGVSWTSGTNFEGGEAADIANGVMVFAKGRYDANSKSVAATWIEIVKADSATPRVAGAVSDFVSLADFRIGGQRIDASGAVLLEGQASDLGNGDVVMVSGSIVERNGARVLVANKLRFMQ